MGRVLFLVRVRHDDPETEAAKDTFHFDDEPLVARDIVRTIVKLDAAIRGQRDAILVTGQILRDGEPVNTSSDPRVVGPERNPGDDRLRHDTVRPSLRLN